MQQTANATLPSARVLAERHGWEEKTSYRILERKLSHTLAARQLQNVRGEAVIIGLSDGKASSVSCARWKRSALALCSAIWEHLDIYRKIPRGCVCVFHYTDFL